MINTKLLEYALHSIRRRFWQRGVVVLIFSLLVFLLISVFSIAGSLRGELLNNLASLPEIFVQKIQGGRQVDIPIDHAFEIASIAGVTETQPRVWGYYSLPGTDVILTIIGVDPELPATIKKYEQSIAHLDIKDATSQSSFFIAGEGAAELLKQYGYEATLNLYSHQGKQIVLSRLGLFKSDVRMETNDVILVSENSARELFGTHPYKATDIVVRIPNPNELETVKQKIQFMFPDTRIVSTSDLNAAYDHIFNYRSGVFLALLMTTFMSFFTLVIDKGSGISLDERREIGIMKAVGWSINNILTIKLYESLYIVLLSYITGLLAAYIFVFEFGAPLIIELFTGASRLKPELTLTPYIDVKLLVLSFLAIVPLYIFASIIPAWRASMIDADEVMR
jgi:putative ABC transport system permease protein